MIKIHLPPAGIGYGLTAAAFSERARQCTAELDSRPPPPRPERFGRTVAKVAKSKLGSRGQQVSSPRPPVIVGNAVREAVKRQQQRQSGPPSPQQVKENAEKEKERYKRPAPRPRTGSD